MIDALMGELGIDGLLVTSGTNRRYLTGFTPADHAPDETSGVILVTAGDTTLFTSGTNLPWAQSEVREGVTVQRLSGLWPCDIATAVQAHGITRLGYEDFSTVVAHFNDLRSRLGEKVSFVEVGHAVDQRRAIKSTREIEALQCALATTDEAFVSTCRQVREGQTERKLADIVEEELRTAGSEALAFDVIVASGPNAAKPHHSPGERRICRGEPIIIDMGAQIDGYCGDLTRTLWIGQPSGQLVTMYQKVAIAHSLAIAAVRPGMTGRDLDAVARNYFKREDLEQLFLHGLGHGLGLRIHEGPSVGMASDDVLAVGQVVTIEPGLYDPAWGGVRIEDVVLVEKDGCRNMTTAPKMDVLQS